MTDQETEVKFHVRNIKKIELRLLALGAELIQTRVHEINYRYDLPDGSLKSSGRVLRLRNDNRACLTFKGPSTLIDGIFSRQEFEFTVSSFETAQQFLRALGYVQILIYEKYRSTYEMKDCHIMLDELPYGDFVEIEGADTSTIREISSQIGLSFDSAVGAGYSRIFENYNSRYGFPASDLTFEAFNGKKPTAEELNVRAAD
jgi:adenylate cyclase, class 2